MRIGLPISAFLHALILGFALLQLGTAKRELKPIEPEPVAVDIVSEAELTKLKQGNRRAKESEPAPKTNVSETLKETPPKPKVAIVTPPPPKPEVKAEPKPKPKPVDPTPVLEAMKANEPKPPEKAPEVKPAEPVKVTAPPKEPPPPADVLEAMKANEPKPVEKTPEPPKPPPAKEPPKVAHKPAPQPRKPLLPKPPPKPPQVAVAAPPPQPNRPFDVNDPDALSKLLLDKTPNRRPPPPSTTQAQTTLNTPPKSTLGAPEGRDQQLSASEVAALGAIVKRRIREEGCWGVQGGGIDADRIQVKLRVRFNADGSVIGQPQVMNTEPARAFQVASENAVRAVLACQPYPLPPDKFSAWQDMILNFVPRDM